MMSSRTAHRPGIALHAERRLCAFSPDVPSRGPQPAPETGPLPEAARVGERLRTDADLKARTQQIVQDLQVTVDEQRELIGRMSATLGEPLNPQLTTVAHLLQIARAANFIDQPTFNGAVARLPGGAGIVAPGAQPGGPVAPEGAQTTDFSTLVLEPGGTATMNGQRMPLDYLRTLIAREQNVTQLALALRGLEQRGLQIDGEYEQLAMQDAQVNQANARLQNAVFSGRINPRAAAQYQQQINAASRSIRAQAAALVAEGSRLRMMVAELTPRVPAAMRPQRAVVEPGPGPMPAPRGGPRPVPQPAPSPQPGPVPQPAPGVQPRPAPTPQPRPAPAPVESDPERAEARASLDAYQRVVANTDRLVELGERGDNATNILSATYAITAENNERRGIAFKVAKLPAGDPARQAFDARKALLDAKKSALDTLYARIQDEGIRAFGRYEPLIRETDSAVADAREATGPAKAEARRAAILKINAEEALRTEVFVAIRKLGPGSTVNRFGVRGDQLPRLHDEMEGKADNPYDAMEAGQAFSRYQDGQVRYTEAAVDSALRVGSGTPDGDRRTVQNAFDALAREESIRAEVLMPLLAKISPTCSTRIGFDRRAPVIAAHRKAVEGAKAALEAGTNRGRGPSETDPYKEAKDALILELNALPDDYQKYQNLGARIAGEAVLVRQFQMRLKEGAAVALYPDLAADVARLFQQRRNLETAAAARRPLPFDEDPRSAATPPVPEARPENPELSAARQRLTEHRAMAQASDAAVTRALSGVGTPADALQLLVNERAAREGLKADADKLPAGDPVAQRFKARGEMLETQISAVQALQPRGTPLPVPRSPGSRPAPAAGPERAPALRAYEAALTTVKGMQAPTDLAISRALAARGPDRITQIDEALRLIETEDAAWKKLQADHASVIPERDLIGVIAVRNITLRDKFAALTSAKSGPEPAPDALTPARLKAFDDAMQPLKARRAATDAARKEATDVHAKRTGSRDSRLLTYKAAFAAVDGEAKDLDRTSAAFPDVLGRDAARSADVTARRDELRRAQRVIMSILKQEGMAA